MFNELLCKDLFEKIFVLKVNLNFKTQMLSNPLFMIKFDVFRIDITLICGGMLIITIYI